jgi:hypothetical protein
MEFTGDDTLQMKKIGVFNIDILGFVMYTYKEYGLKNKSC